MRILFYDARPEWSGRTRALATAARGLAQRGHTVGYGCVPESAVERRLDLSAYEVLPIARENGWSGAVWRLRAALPERAVEAVVVGGAREQIIACLAARASTRTAVVRRLTGTDPLAGRWRDRLALRLTPVIPLVGNEDARRAATAAGSPPVLAPLGVDADAYDAVRPVPRASISDAGAAQLIVCRYHPLGRLAAANLLRVAALLAARHPGLRLAFVGPRSDDEELRMHAAALRLAKRVSFLGERPDTHAVMRAADIAWMAATGDEAAFGMLDAAALRLPVVAERSEVARMYVADGITGVLVNGGDAPATAALVAKLLAHEEQRVAMGNAGRARVARDFTETAFVDGVERAAAMAADMLPLRADAVPGEVP